MRQGLQDDISKVIKSELAAAIKDFPLYHSAHEGYAVLKEEVEEATADLNVAVEHFEMAWECIKANTNPVCLITELGRYAQLLACEAVQMAAVAQKFVKSSEGWK